MLYELAYPVLLVGAKSQQAATRAKVRLRLAPPELRSVVYKPETRYRTLCWAVRKLDIELMMRLSPAQAARVAIRRFETTKRDPRAQERLARPEAFVVEWIDHRGVPVRVRRYGRAGGPKVLALHGWNGKGAMLHGLALAMAGAGFEVLVPDLPGHGASGGKRYAFPELGRAVTEMFAPEGRFAALIGHSGGGLIASIALTEGFPARTYVPIGAPSSLARLLRSYVEVSHMPPEMLTHIERRYDRRHGRPIAALGAPGLSGLDLRTLVIHDRDDWMVAVDNADDWMRHARAGELELTSRLTHLSIVNAPRVHERVIGFVRGAADA